MVPMNGKNREISENSGLLGEGQAQDLRGDRQGLRMGGRFRGGCEVCREFPGLHPRGVGEPWLLEGF